MSEQLSWFKSSYSDSSGGACVEVAISPGAIHVRDSKLGAEGPRFAVEAGAWSDFLGYAAR
ncbi:DUF397 domain-containing protein [Streptomyces sp. SID2888]|uniref:DUF397 domain-containing protein n=1 Tax=Streptomyces sp. SID2888 TaxID=2690256 RepID=UPI001368E6ED|nr:DUF397 domain-containing protein [Streptomyces sp. SID2888]MYV44732.1 DUF397 domain-containing protein [Streptomyces sp. SID2888]